MIRTRLAPPNTPSPQAPTTADYRHTTHSSLRAGSRVAAAILLLCAGVACATGVDSPVPDSPGQLLPDGGVLLSDGGVLLSDGAVVSGPGQGDAGGDGGGSDSGDGGGTGNFPYAVSNVDPGDYTYAGDPSIDCGPVTFDTDALTPSEWCGVAIAPVVAMQVDGPEVVVVPLAGLTVEDMNTLKFTGSRPVVLLVDGDVVIDGMLDVSADATVPGPGGDDPLEDSHDCALGTGEVGETDRGGNNGAGGGGGGGFGQPGAAGSAGRAGGDGGAGGAAEGTDSLSPLRAGCAGGRGGNGWTSVDDLRWGGAGGGAIQISAAGDLTVGATGVIDAGGGGGSTSTGGEDGGGGGGSGGGILLQAVTLAVTGAVVANGGGGAEGMDTDSGNGSATPGQDGRPDDIAALGGSSAPTELGGHGGNGGLPSGAAPTAGMTNYSNNGDGGGGGGGGAGRVVLIEG